MRVNRLNPVQKATYLKKKNQKSISKFKSLFQNFCHLDFKSLLFSEYLSDFAHFGVILFVGTSFIIFQLKCQETR